MSLHNIVKTSFKGLDLNEEHSLLIFKSMSRLNLQKGDVLIKNNTYVDHMYYIQEGCLRTFHTDANGKEHTIQFGIKDWWITDYTAFFANTKSIMSLEALSDTLVYKLSRNDRLNLIETIPGFGEYVRIKLERAYASFQRRILNNLSLTAAESYQSFITLYPNIEGHVKNYHIASYLGMTTETLSRIRRELLK